MNTSQLIEQVSILINGLLPVFIIPISIVFGVMLNIRIIKEIHTTIDFLSDHSFPIEHVSYVPVDDTEDDDDEWNDEPDEQQTVGPAIIFCAYCGSPHVADALRCDSCGAPLRDRRAYCSSLKAVS